VNGHAKQHSEENNHLIALSINTTSAYCYACNDFIDESDDELSQIRQELNIEAPASDSETSITLEEASTKSHQQEPETTSSTSSYDSGLDSLSSHGIKILRPRKRTKSDDESESQKNVKKKNTGKKRGVGLKNLGNTCFMNSVLQSLHNIQQFSYYFSNLPKIEQPKSRLYTRSIKENLDEIFLIEELRKVLIDLNSGADNNKASISPECLFLVIWKVVPQFKGYHQHDAHEFLRYMLDRLHTELQSVSNSVPQAPTNSKMKNFVCPLPTKKGSSFVTNVFGGTLLSEVKCLMCGQESRKHDPFLDLSLDIPEKYYKDLEESDKPQTCHITDCLSSFVAIEELTETELYYCSTCKKKQRSTKRFWNSYYR
jgi:ubiquitin carboxyl-terminal hydrolase 3